MKYSVFNSVISLVGDKSVIYNSLQDKFIIFNSTLISLTAKVDELEKTNLIFYQRLVENKFIVDDSLDEYASAKERILTCILDSTKYTLIINPTLNCNFKCWYCYETKTKSKLDTDTIDKIYMAISNILHNRELTHFELSFFGGEPLMYFDVIRKLMNYTSTECKRLDKVFSVGVTTNASLINDNMVAEFSKYSKTCRFQITLDGDRELHDKVRYYAKDKGSYDVIMNNISLLVKNGIFVVVRLNFTQDNINVMRFVIDDLNNTIDNKNKIRISLQRIWQDRDNKDLNEEIDTLIEYCSTKGFKAGTPVLDGLAGSCYADKMNQSLINFNGDVYKCTAIDFMTTPRDGVLGNNGEIVWENNSLNQRINERFNNKSCQLCRIFPICNGGCSQKAMTNLNKDYCIFNYNEKQKDIEIINRLKFNLYNNSAWNDII